MWVSLASCVTATLNVRNRGLDDDLVQCAPELRSAHHPWRRYRPSRRWPGCSPARPRSSVRRAAAGTALQATGLVSLTTKSLGLTEAAVVTVIFNTDAGSAMTMPGTGVGWPFSSAQRPVASCVGAIGQNVLLVFEAQLWGRRWYRRDAPDSAGVGAGAMVKLAGGKSVA